MLGPTVLYVTINIKLNPWQKAWVELPSSQMRLFTTYALHLRGLPPFVNVVSQWGLNQDSLLPQLVKSWGHRHGPPCLVHLPLPCLAHLSLLLQTGTKAVVQLVE